MHYGVLGLVKGHPVRPWLDGAAIPGWIGTSPVRRGTARLGILACVVVLSASAAAQGATVFVDDDAPGDPGPGNPLVSDPLEDGSAGHPYDSLQEAIAAAIDGVDEVVALSGTYRGSGNVNVDFLGKAITVRSLDGPAATVVDCENAPETRGFVFQSSEQLATVLDGFTITGGNMQGATPSQQRGGAIYCASASPTIRNCRLIDNLATEGGGFASFESAALFVRCRFENNTATGDGGGLFNTDGYPKLINSVFLNNSAGGSGGGMYHFSCSFGDGPGPELTNCLIANNVAQGSGGGIASIEVCFTILKHCTISGNMASVGGGMVHDYSQFILFNSIVWANAPDGLVTLDELFIPQVFYTDMQGGHEGDGNIDLDPLFVDPNGDNFRLKAGSPCIDAGSPTPIHGDEADLDGNGVTNEPLPVDLDDTLRVEGVRADMGAFERGLAEDSVGPCCLGDDGCSMLPPDDCAAQGGTFLGLNDPLNPDLTCAETRDNDGVADLCDNCPNDDNAFQGDCDNDGEGDACEADRAEQDDDFDGVCNGVDGCPNDPSKSVPGDGFHQAPGICGCGCTDPCEDCDSDEWCNSCCSRPDNCGDQCPNDPSKMGMGICGCGVPDEGDEDGDGFLDCVDQCRGVDDAIFAPQCSVAIPAVSEWGFVILALLLLVAGKVYFASKAQAKM